ncbi:MAG: type II secretion system GspH family protein [Planctomycetes bacterium]|nr:type II secretion system GspH family protein [Planctomycetota bacterium]
MANSRYHSGVTLVEMLVVLGIIVVLAGIVVTVTLRVDTQSKENALRNAFALVGSALREYYEAKGQFPPQAERNPANALAHIESMCQELRLVPASRQVLDRLAPGVVKGEGGSADLRSMRDPWGTVMDYVCLPDSTFPELISAGPDRQFGTGDDLSNKGVR